MKRYSSILLMLLAMVAFVSCSDQNKSEEDNTSESEEVRMEKPEELGMSADSLQGQVQQEAIDVVESSKDQMVAEAVDALEQVYTALDFLANENSDAALEALEKATGKFEILLARDPSLAFVPIDASVKTVDLVADLETIKNIKKAARKAIKEDRFQALRDELTSLASEIQVTTVEMPLATFPPAIKRAAALVEKDDLEGAKNILYTALNTLIVKEERIPLPILRAQAMIDQAKGDDASDEDKKKEVLQLLQNAEYQLILAEELGYGERGEEYGELNKAIKELKKSVEEDGDSQGLFDSLKTKLSDFRKRIAS
ncbi:hypothetical protein GCM10009122_23950 [Fulvivirga kasyanovii]|uniref:YfdX family protein n=1 Tax=Fulvivirga kasyanovii TaxID=396812 RepID=A0ABW9RVR9_9BACT|nr:YfdX family protein [Fulvivirga kasyanovii]MTI27095.1 YfdX family protein [Fulvivirga kasyanovii]